jgi:hypothetical protein
MAFPAESVARTRSVAFSAPFGVFTTNIARPPASAVLDPNGTYVAPWSWLIHASMVNPPLPEYPDW